MNGFEALLINCAIGLVIGVCALPWRLKLSKMPVWEWLLTISVAWQLAIIGALGMWATGGFKKRN